MGWYMDGVAPCVLFMSRLCNSSHEVPPCLVVHRVPSQKTGNVGGGSVLQAVFLVPSQKSGNLRGGSVLQAALRVPSQKGGNTSESNFQRDGVLQVVGRCLLGEQSAEASSSP